MRSSFTLKGGLRFPNGLMIPSWVLYFTAAAVLAVLSVFAVLSATNVLASGGSGPVVQLPAIPGVGTLPDPSATSVVVATQTSIETEEVLEELSSVLDTPTPSTPIKMVFAPLDMDEMPECAEKGTSKYPKENFSIHSGTVILFETSGDVYHATPVNNRQLEDYCMGEVIHWAGLNIDWNFGFWDESCGYIASHDMDYLWDLPENIFVVYATKSRRSLEPFEGYVLWFMVYDIEGIISCGRDSTIGVETGR